MTILDKKIEAIKFAASKAGCVAFLYGDILKYRLTKENQHLRYNVIDVILSGECVVNEFYKKLTTKIVVNREIERSDYKYYIESDDYIIQFHLDKTFDPVNKESVLRYSTFSVEAIFQNLISDEIIDFTNHGVNDLISTTVTVSSITDPTKWTAKDILLFATRLGEYHSAVIDNNDRELISRLDDAQLKSIADISLKDLLLDLLLTFQPGNAIGFFATAFADSKKWFFIKLIDLISELNIPIKEGIKTEEVFSEKRLELINIYNEFFLSEKIAYETPDKRSKRLHATLKLLFDTPVLSFDTPYIDRVSILSANNADSNADSDFETLATCPYPPCSPCNPEDCSPHQCCCCSSIDIVSSTQYRCFKQTVLSCNSDASGYGIRSEEKFPSGCDDCHSACEAVLGLNPDFEYCDNWENTGWNEGWWSIPYSHWPCSCNCAHSQPGAPGDCGLTCVQCKDWYCGSVASISGHDCSYEISLAPASDCCGSPAIIDWMFVIDYSSSMDSKIAQVVDECKNLADSLSSKGANVRFGLTVFGTSINGVMQDRPTVLIPFTDDVEAFKAQMPTTTSGGNEYDIEAVCLAATSSVWRGHANFIMLLGDEASQFRTGDCYPEADCIERAKTLLNFYNITFFSVGITTDRISLANYSGGKVYSFDEQFSAVVDDLQVSVYPTSCDCMDTSPIRIRRSTPECTCCPPGQTQPCVDDPLNYECIQNLPEKCFEIPINICYPGQTCDCSQPIALNACGNTIVIRPTNTNMECCDQIGMGCTCNSPCDPAPCCGPECYNLCEEFKGFPIGTEEGRRIVADIIWCDCWDKKADIDRDATPNCTDCCCPDGLQLGDANFPCSRLNSDDPLCQGENLSECQELLANGNCCSCLQENKDDCCNCCLKFIDGQCGTTLRHCFPDIRQKTEIALAACSSGPVVPQDWEPPNLECQKDKCIVGEPDLSGDKSIDEQCDNIHKGCTLVKHPSTTVLNNGIGLVAYESITDSSVIYIQQFKTSVKNKLMPNRELNFGRLEHWNNWEIISGSEYLKAKLYVYEDLPVQLITTDTVDPSDPSSWKDAIGFKTGPLEKQFFPLASPPYGEDDNGTYILFFAKNDLSNSFPSSDDVYNVKFFMLNYEDSSLIGDAEDSTTEGQDYIFESREEVDQQLLLPPHIYNGNKVPVAYPSIATAYNYNDPAENAHFVFLSYQALENNKWNIYLRQIRLSEYSYQKQLASSIQSNALTSLSELGISEIILKIICTSDEVNVISEQEYLAKRNITFEVITADGRDVLNNPDLSGNWPSLCKGFGSGEFDKSKVYGTFSHSITCNISPSQQNLDQVFNQWRTGQEFHCPVSSSLAEEVFSVLIVPESSAVAIGDYSPPLDVAGILISNSKASVAWYKDSQETTWSVIDDSSYNTLFKFKGMNIGDPILISSNDSEHCTHPVVKVNCNNDVFIAYESTTNNSQQIKIAGTTTPSSCLPTGVLVNNGLDASLDYFLRTDSFIYSQQLTSNGINQMPDMFIDLNDVIHLCWHSNRDNRWEIYYANSETDFTNKRITNYDSKSLKPKLDGDNNGRLYITWHDNRFGNYEIMLAHCLTTRTLPLCQQDPYLASLRNSYAHYTGIAPLSIQNNTDTSICYSRIIVDFYTDRTLENYVFSIDQNEYPFCFESDGLLNDTTALTFNSFADWSEEPYTESPGLEEHIICSAEYDSSLLSSYVSWVNASYALLEQDSTIEIAFKASDYQNDHAATWSDWVVLSNGDTYVELPQTTGRYKSVQLKLTYTELVPEIYELTITSEIHRRTCVASNSLTSVNFSLSPVIRLDEFGNTTANIAMPIGFESNQTYFIKVRAEDNDGYMHEMPEHPISMSCYNCKAADTDWNYKSCSIKIPLVNDESYSAGFNVTVSIYYDKERTKKVKDFEAKFGSSDLRFFTVEHNNESAEQIWTSYGCVVKNESSTVLVLCPMLSQTVGLLCGIKYYVDIQTCSASIDNKESCNNMQLASSFEWICDCSSLRYTGAVDDSPVSLSSLIRWESSAYGKFDTRITETKCSNLNPTIKIRSNLNGVVVYESNRENTSNTIESDTFRIYASVFSVTPSANSYSSSSESIASPFQSLVYRSDIPICSNESEFTCSGSSTCNNCLNEIGVQNNSAISGQNLSFSLDQYDSIFMACETAYSSDCNNLSKNKATYITVHTCGADSLDLFKTNVGDATSEPTKCSLSEILSKTFDGEEVVKQIRVQNEYVQYYVTTGGKQVPVVSISKIGLILVGTERIIAVRLRNDSGNWGEWLPSSSEIGENTIEINDWQLSSVSGLKNIEFQCATNAGVTPGGSIDIIADYIKINYDIIFYKPTSAIQYPPEVPDLTNTAIWAESNILSTFNGVPVASTRSPFILNESTVIPESDYIFVEIIPDQEYMSGIETLPDSQRNASFDLIQQGEEGQRGIQTVWGTSNGKKVFRGYITIRRENKSADKDGLAYIIPYFKEDHYSTMSSNAAASVFSKDTLNVVSGESSETSQLSDLLSQDRDDFGFIKHKQVIRTNADDPYFIFGDPDCLF